MKIRKQKFNLLKCLLIVIVAVVLLCTTVVWVLFGAPIYDFGLGNADVTGKSYSYGRCIYGNSNTSMELNPRLMITDNRELLQVVTGSDGVAYAETVVRLRTRISLTSYNFNDLISGGQWCCMLSDGDPIDAEYIKAHYTAAWLDIPRDNENKQFFIYILMDDGNIFVANGWFGRNFDGKDYPTCIDNIQCLDYYGDAQKFHDFLNEENN